MSGMAGIDPANPSASCVKLTYDDFMLFPDDGRRHELIDGEHYVTPSPNIGHQEMLGRLHLLIGNWLVAHPIGRVYFAPLDVVFSSFDVVDPTCCTCPTSGPQKSSRRCTYMVCRSWSWRSVQRARAGATRRSSCVSTSERACPSTGSSIPMW